MTSRTIALTALALTAVSGVIAWIATRMNDSTALAVLAAYALALIGSGIWLGSFASTRTPLSDTSSRASSPVHARVNLHAKPH